MKNAFSVVIQQKQSKKKKKENGGILCLTVTRCAMFHLSQTTSFYLPVTKLLNLVEALADHSVQHLYLELDKLRADV